MADSFLLQEIGDKITLEDGSGFILLEVSAGLSEVTKLNVGNMIAIDSLDFHDYLDYLRMLYLLY